MPGIEATFLESMINKISRPDLYVVLWETPTPQGKVVRGYWMFKKDIFQGAAAERLNEAWLAILAAIAGDPESTVEALWARSLRAAKLLHKDRDVG